MFSLIHFLFTLFKIAMLASLYATIILLILIILNKSINSSLLKNWMNRKLLIWWLNGFIVSVGLLFFSLSYWGNHGFGDSSRIPIGDNQTIHSIDGISYFNPTQGGQELINTYSIKNNHICAKQNNFILCV